MKNQNGISLIALIIIIIAIIILVIGGFFFLSPKKKNNGAMSHNEILREIYEEESLKNENNEETLKKSKLDIKVLGKSVNLPFDLEYLTKKGCTFVDEEEEKNIYSAENQTFYSVIMTNENEKQETMYGSPYLNFDLSCGDNSANSLKNISVVGINIQAVEKKFLSINGFGWNDSMEDIINSIGNDYTEELGTYNENIKNGTYQIEYSYSDLIVDIRSEDGLISLIRINTASNNE